MAFKPCLLHTISCILASLAIVAATVGLPDCTHCLSLDIHDAPGIGFDLTPSYGISAVNFHNGSTRDLVKVNGSQDYRDLMARLLAALEPERKSEVAKHRWYQEESDLDILISAFRRILYGRPVPSSPPNITQDILILSDLLHLLKVATEAELGCVVDNVVVTHPPFPALTDEGIGLAVTHAGLQSWLHMPSDLSIPPHLSTSKAAFGGHGLAPPGYDFDMQPVPYYIPDKPRGQYFTLDEGEDPRFSFEEFWTPEPRDETVYLVSLTSHALYTSLATYQRPFGYPMEHELYHFDLAAGLQNLDLFSDEEAYWHT